MSIINRAEAHNDKEEDMCLQTYKLSAKYSRTIPDPNANYIKKHIFLCPVKSLPLDLPYKNVNARVPNTNRLIYKEVEKTLLNENGTANIFHQKNSGITIIADQVKKNFSIGNLEDYTLVIDDEKKQGIANGNHTYSIIGRNMKNNPEAITDHQYVTIEVLTGVDDELAHQISQGLNTSIQVHEKSLQNLKGNFEWLKKCLGEKLTEKIAFSENQNRPYDVREILSILYTLNVRLFPNENFSQPTSAYNSSAKVLNTFIKNPDAFQAMVPIVKECLILFETIICGDEKYRGYRHLWNKGGGKAAAWNATETKKKEAHQFYFINQESKYKLDRSFAFPIISSFRWFIEDDGKELNWSIPFDKVTKAWEKNGYILLYHVREAWYDNKQNYNTVGKMRSLYSQLHSTMGLRK